MCEMDDASVQVVMGSIDVVLSHELALLIQREANAYDDTGEPVSNSKVTTREQPNIMFHRYWYTSNEI
jgi:hypothetical protein